MITSVRSANIQNAAVVEAAFEWAVKLAMYLNENFDMNTQVLRNITGPVYQVHWVTTSESLAQGEELTRKLQGDAGYLALLAEAGEQGLFDISSIENYLYQSVP